MNETQSFRLYDLKTQVLEIFSKDLKPLISSGDISDPHFLRYWFVNLSNLTITNFVKLKMQKEKFKDAIKNSK